MAAHTGNAHRFLDKDYSLCFQAEQPQELDHVLLAMFGALGWSAHHDLCTKRFGRLTGKELASECTL